MKLKNIVIIFIIGFVLVIIGSFLKMSHLQGAKSLLIMGLGFQALGALLSIIKLIKTKSFKAFKDR